MPVDDLPTWDSLDEFTQGYIECTFFTNSGDTEDEIQDQGFSDFAPEALESIIQDCAKFQEQHADLLERACDVDGYDMQRAGNDFWFTRNGHGVGFWDRGLGDVGDDLETACGWRTDFGEVWLYLGDDGKIYVS
jgi:hypothetical protein